MQGGLAYTHLRNYQKFTHTLNALGYDLNAKLVNAKRLGELHDFVEFREIERYFDKLNAVGAYTYMFFYKGDFKSFGCTIQTAEAETTKTMLYDGSENYGQAFRYFKNQSPLHFVYLFDRLQGEDKKKNNEME